MKEEKKKKEKYIQKARLSAYAWAVALESCSLHCVCSEALPGISQLPVRSCTESTEEDKEQLGGEQERNAKL